TIAFEGSVVDGVKTTLSVANPTAARTVAIPDANSATAQAVTCNGTDKVSGFNAATGAFLCSPDVRAGSGGTRSLVSVGLALPSICMVSGSPVTVSGTLTGPLATESTNTVFAGPSSGGAGAPTFRALVDADMPSGYAAKGLRETGGPTVLTMGAVADG